MKKKLAATAMGAALLAGGGAGAALMTPFNAGAATESTDSAADTATDAAPEETADAPRAQWMTDALAQLVEADTITQAQADAVAEALKAARPDGGPGHVGRGPGPGLTVAATAIGISEDDLRTALQGGDTIADVARAKGVDVTTVIDAIVAEMNSHLDEAVADGHLTQAQADERKANATERATDLVNGELPARGPGGPGGFGGPPPGADSSTGDSSTGDSSTDATT
jgi:hypothetical protein